MITYFGRNALFEILTDCSIYRYADTGTSGEIALREGWREREREREGERERGVGEGRERERESKSTD